MCIITIKKRDFFIGTILQIEGLKGRFKLDTLVVNDHFIRELIFLFISLKIV